MTRTIILGAGMSGLAAARRLQAAGHEVLVVDKGRSVGGRLATRRIGAARLDHGAQFFTTRGPDFAAFVAEAMRAGAVDQWCLGFGEPDGYPRYRGRDGMTSLAKWMATGLDVRVDLEVDRIELNADELQFVAADERVIASASQAVVTAPIPQMLTLVDRGKLALPPELDSSLRQTRYFATLALLVVVEGEPNIDEPGGMQFDDGPFTFIADNQRKGISPVRALTFHAEHDYSLLRYDDEPDQVKAELIEQAAPWIGDATIVEAQVKKWRYAGPQTPLAEATYVVDAGNARLALAGDAFAGPKVEGAFNSGTAAAAALLQVS